MSESDKNETKKPKESQFHQQKLPSWNPSILMSTIYPFFGSIGLLFILIGVGLLLSSISVNEHELDYTYCQEFNSDLKNYTNRVCSTVLNINLTSNFSTCTCRIDFKLKHNFKGPVYFYYYLQNFYQNHRRYFGSRDDKQLNGKINTKVSTDCDPYGSVQNGSTYLNYAPCGAIANSLFNDTFTLFYINGSSNIAVNMSNKGIAWSSDVNILFGKPINWDNTLKPINWKNTALERDKDSYKNDEELLVWMRTAPLSAFKKLNRIVKHDSEPFLNGLPSGDYQLFINYAYPVTVFGGRKKIFLSNTSAMGGKNNNLGIMYIVLGSIHELIAFVFFVFTIYKKDTDGSYSTEMLKRPMKRRKSSFSDTPLITSPLSPESYGLQDMPLNDETHTVIR